MMMIVMIMMMEEEDFQIKHFMWVRRGPLALSLIYMHLRSRKFLVSSYNLFPPHIFSSPIRIFLTLYLCQTEYVVNCKIPYLPPSKKRLISETGKIKLQLAISDKEKRSNSYDEQESMDNIFLVRIYFFCKLSSLWLLKTNF